MAIQLHGAHCFAPPPPPPPTMGSQVREVHCRLMAYWQRQALIEAAAEKFHVVSVGPSQPTVKAAVPLGSGAAAGKVGGTQAQCMVHCAHGCGQ